MQRHPMTPEGEAALREELHRRKQQDRPAITAAIAEARAHGDLKENAEYHAAREQQSFNEGRIKEIESKLASAQVIDITKIAFQGKVVFGCIVRITNVETEISNSYRIVGEDEADINRNRISYNSPIARGLIGKELEDEVEIQTPNGQSLFIVESIEHNY